VTKKLRGLFPRLRRDNRGSLFVEFICVFPMFAALWTLSIYAFGYHQRGILNERHVRECALHYAMGGCRALPAGCTEDDGGRVEDGALRAAARGNFETIVSGLPFLRGQLASLHGEWTAITRTIQVPRPQGIGGSVGVTNRYAVLCNTEPPRWELPQVFQLTCRQIGLWCP